MNYVWIGIAGIVGTWLRYGLGLGVQRLISQPMFPIGTLLINLIGCFALGWFSHWVMDKPYISPSIRTSISTGLIGSFTTYSTFSVETVQLFRQGLYGSGMTYVSISLVGGLCLVWFGTWIAGKGRGRTEHG